MKWNLQLSKLNRIRLENVEILTKKKKSVTSHKARKKIEPSFNVGSQPSIINTLVSQPNTKKRLKIRKNNKGKIKS